MPAELPFPERNSRQESSYALAAPRRSPLIGTRRAYRGRPGHLFAPATSDRSGTHTLPESARKPALMPSWFAHGLEHTLRVRASRIDTHDAVHCRQVLANGGRKRRRGTLKPVLDAVPGPAAEAWRAPHPESRS